MTTDFERLLAKKAPERRLIVPIDVTDAQETELDEARAAIQMAEAGEKTVTVAMKKRLAAAVKAVQAGSIVMVIRSCGATRWDLLVTDNPPTQVDHDRMRQISGVEDINARWHSDTFNPALVAASCVSPAMTVDQVCQLFDTWSNGEKQVLIQAAMDVNTGSRVDTEEK